MHSDNKQEIQKQTVVQKGKPGPLPKPRINEESIRAKRELRLNKEDKFLKYTNEGYVPPIEDETTKIRWR